MVSVTGMTVAEINRQLDEMIVNASIDELGQLILERKSGEEINAGSLTDAALAVSASWPVGSIYTAMVPTNPGDPSMLGVGTWVRYGKGRVLVSQDDTVPEFATVGQEGGSKTHTLTAAEGPVHSHVMTHDHAVSVGAAGNHAHNVVVTYRDDINNTGGGKEAITGVGGANHGDNDGGDTGVTTTTGNHTHSADITPFTGSTQSAGGSGGVTQPHNNLQPYITVYVWRRTA